MTGLVLIAAAYLLGSIPSAFLLARYLRGIDIRDYGSGNVGASNVMEHVGLRTGIALGVFDTLFKGTMPVVAANLMGQSPAVQGAVAIAAIAGHNWSAYLKMTGGRGIAIGIGVLLGMGLWIELAFGLLLIGLMGRVVMKDTGIWSLVSFLALPVASVVADCRGRRRPSSGGRVHAGGHGPAAGGQASDGKLGTALYRPLRTGARPAASLPVGQGRTQTGVMDRAHATGWTD